MSRARPTDPPRHYAGARHFQGSKHKTAPSPAFDDIPIDFDDIELGLDGEPTDAPPPVRVKESRLAFAVAVTLAALPVLVLDNFTAQADSPDPVAVEVVHDTPADEAAPRFVRSATPVPFVTSEVPATTATTEAPATTVAPPTTEAPTTTEAATTTEAPTTTKAPAPTTTTTIATRAAPAAASPHDPATWEALAECESAGNWAANTGNGYYGGLQFSKPTWDDMGGTGYPHEAPKATQIELGKRLYERSGWTAWPTCARKLGWL